MPDEDKRPISLVDGLMAKRTVALEGRITADVTKDVGKRLLTLQMQSNEPIKLLINSGGGSTFAALELCDLMSSIMTAPIHATAIGTCGSAATFVMLHCNKRRSTRYSQFLIHSGTKSEITVPVNQRSSELLESLIKEIRDTEELVTRLYMEHLTPKAWEGRTPTEEERRDFVRELLGRGDQRFDQWFFAKHAIEIGLIQEITTTKLDIF